MVDENEQTYELLQRTGASYSTVSLEIQPPASEQRQNQRQDNPTDESVKREVVDLTEHCRQGDERALREREKRVIDDNLCEEERRLVRN